MKRLKFSRWGFWAGTGSDLADEFIFVSNNFIIFNYIFFCLFSTFLPPFGVYLAFKISINKLLCIRILQEKIEQKQREIDELKRDREVDARTAANKIDSLLAELQQREFVIEDYKKRINEMGEKLERVAEGMRRDYWGEFGLWGFYVRMEWNMKK